MVQHHLRLSMFNNRLALCIFSTLLFLSCKKGGSIVELPEEDPQKQYLKNLREYKKSPHKMAVGYFHADGNIDGGPGDMRLLPDSIDFISSFGDPRGVYRANKELYMANLDHLHKRGTRIVHTMFITGFNRKNPDGTRFYEPTDEGVARYVEDAYNTTILDTMGFDGLDLDIETGVFAEPRSMHDKIVKAFRKKLGPDKLLIVDTNTGFANLGISIETFLECVDYINIQDYWGSGFNYKVDGFIAAGYPSERIMDIAADFQDSYTSTTTANGPPRLEAFYTNPTVLAKVGGFGVYGVGYDQPSGYQYYRKMINTLNPPSVD